MDLPYSLTATQIKILEMASDGLTDKEISRTLGIAPGTLRTYWDRMRRRCHSRSRTEVIAKMQHGLSPKRLRLILLEKMPFYIWIMTPRGRPDYCNEWFTSSGKMSRKEALQAGIAPLIVEREREAFTEFLREGLKSGSTFENHWNLSADGGETERLHKIRVFPLGGQDRWIAYCREIAGDADQQMTKFLCAILS